MKLLSFFLLMLPLSAFPLSEGEVFPNLTLDDIANGEAKGVHSYFGKKTILHVFASW